MRGRLADLDDLPDSLYDAVSGSMTNHVVWSTTAAGGVSTAKESLRCPTRQKQSCLLAGHKGIEPRKIDHPGVAERRVRRRLRAKEARRVKRLAHGHPALDAPDEIERQQPEADRAGALRDDGDPELGQIGTDVDIPP